MNDKIFATVKWHETDIQSLRPYWDTVKIKKAAQYAKRQLEDQSVEYGWQVLEELLIMLEGDG